jgi:hypothetical protein
MGRVAAANRSEHSFVAKAKSGERGRCGAGDRLCRFLTALIALPQARPPCLGGGSKSVGAADNLGERITMVVLVLIASVAAALNVSG